MSNYRILPLLLFGVSFCLLAYEISLLRILSFLQWYHFAYLIISLTLLGFAASGTLMHMFRGFWLAHAKASAAMGILLTGLAIVMGRQAMAFIPMDTFLSIWQAEQLLWFAALCLLLFLPFLSGAFFIILTFSTTPERIGVLYAANLLGSGFGSLGALLLLHVLHPLIVPYVLGLITTSLVLLLLPMQRQQIWLAMLGIGITALCWLFPTAPAMSAYKPLPHALLMPDTNVLAEAFNPHGVTHLLRSPHLRAANGLSLSFQGEIPTTPMLFSDGMAAGAVPVFLRGQNLDHVLSQAVFNLPYRVRKVDAVLLLNAGAGMEVARSLGEGISSITAVEKNPAFIHLPEQTLQDYASIYRRPGVQVEIDDPRGFLAHTGQHFNLIVLPPGQSLAATFGMQSLYENYLLTVESFGRMLELLEPNGMIAVSAGMDTPVRRPLKLFALMVESLRLRGVEKPGDHILVVRSWDIATAIMSQTPFSAREQERARQFAHAYGFDMAFPSAAGGRQAEPVHHISGDGLAEKLAGLAATPPRLPDTPFYISPPTDDRPYFNHFLSLAAAGYMLRTVGGEGIVLQEWGYVVAAATIILLGLAGLFLVLLPLWRWQRAHLPGNKRHIGYFASIGAGFMFIEMLFIQKLVLVLAEPVYAVAGVISALLFFAGVGSLLSTGLLAKSGKTICWATAALLGMLVLIFLLYPVAADSLASLSTFWRFAGAILLIAPPATLMGLYFPAGIRMLEAAGNEALIPWAWGINGFISVISTPLALLISLGYGFSVLGMLGMACYLLAAALRPM